MQNDWMLIRGHPDFLILHSAGLWRGESAEQNQSRRYTGFRRILSKRVKIEQRLMSEVPYPGEDHGQPQPVRRLDNLLIPHRASGLNNGSSPRFGDLLDPIRKGKEGIGGGYRPLQ